MSLNKNKILELIIDVTEFEIEKLKDKRKKVYSDKKKKEGKKEISITQDKMIIAILITYNDSIHDMKIRRNEDAIENFIKSDQYRLYCDRGYIELEDINALIPKKNI